MNNKLKIVNVEAAIYKEDKWLFVKRSHKESHQAGSISFVGGTVEETNVLDKVLEETLKREIREEVGLEVATSPKYLTSSHFIADDEDLVVDVVFLCKYKSGEASPVDKDEVSEVMWLTFEEAINNDLIKSWTKNYLRLAQKLR